MSRMNNVEITRHEYDALCIPGAYGNFFKGRNGIGV